MCDATFVGLGIAMVGTAVQGVAQRARGHAAKVADYRSADFADRAAADAVERGNLKELQVTMHGASVVAAQRVIESGTGADVNVGGAKATQDATTAMTEVDRAVVRRNAALEAYGLRERAGAYRQQGEYAEREGDNAAVGTFLSGIARGVGEAGKLYSDMRSADSLKTLRADKLLLDAPPPGED